MLLTEIEMYRESSPRDWMVGLFDETHVFIECGTMNIHQNVVNWHVGSSPAAIANLREKRRTSHLFPLLLAAAEWVSSILVKKKSAQKLDKNSRAMWIGQFHVSGWSSISGGSSL
mgnify:CR=1 FL=1